MMETVDQIAAARHSLRIGSMFWFCDVFVVVRQIEGDAFLLETLSDYSDDAQPGEVIGGNRNDASCIHPHTIFQVADRLRPKRPTKPRERLKLLKRRIPRGYKMQLLFDAGSGIPTRISYSETKEDGWESGYSVDPSVPPWRDVRKTIRAVQRDIQKTIRKERKRERERRAEWRERDRRNAAINAVAG